MKIRHRITLWVAGAGLLTSLVFSSVVFWEMREQPFEILDSQLQATAAALADQLAGARPPSADVPVQMPLISLEHYWVRVFDQDSHPVYESDLAKVVNLPLNRDTGENAYSVTARMPAGQVHLLQNDGGEVAFRVRVFSKKMGGNPYLFQIAKPMEDFQEEAMDLFSAIALGLAVSTVILIGLSYALAGRIVKPIAVINRLAREINENTLEKRIPLPRNHDEIYTLASHLNQMFDRLQFSFARQKRFLADASHELKSPIAMLRLFFEESVQNRDLPPAVQQQLEVQGRKVLRMDRLVKTLLELSKLEIRASLTPAPFDISELAGSVAADFLPLAERLKIRMETEMPRSLEVRGDKDQIRRVFINLFDNAIKYNVEEGRIRWSIREQGEQIHISLENTGPGIPEADLPKVFDPFFRVEKSRSEKYGGSGLGLSIAKEIVRLHMGAISIDSEPGNWVRVNIVLPKSPRDDDH